MLYGTDTESSSGEDANETRILSAYIPSSDEENEAWQNSFVIELVLDDDYKDLIPRELNQIQEFKTFIVPPKEWRLKQEPSNEAPSYFTELGMSTTASLHQMWMNDH